MNNKKRLTYLLACIITVFAALVFLHTFIVSAIYVPDSGSLGTDYMPNPVQSFAAKALASDAGATSSVGTSTASTSMESIVMVSTGAVRPNASSSMPLAKMVPAKLPVMPADYPVRLRIPSLNIDATIQYLGINSKGALGVPNDFTDVGWYAAGTIPGEIGSAVIDGHVDNGLALAGVFKHLATVTVGSDIYVIDHDGTAVHFIVAGVQSFDYKNAPVSAIFNQHDGAFLKLITCGGTWVPGDRTYDRRVVVTAVLVDQGLKSATF